jgi:protein-tyrosine phosphatase
MSTIPTSPTESRFLPLSGSINFRDMGGYHTRDGRQVKWRQLFRCGALSMLSPAAVNDFADLNIGVICDLRRDDEAQGSPTPVQPPFDVRRHIPIKPGSNDMLRESIRDSSQSAADRIRFMTDITRELARHHQAEYRQLFDYLQGCEGGFLFHCSAGKDRTGFGAALILAALGVDEETIMADYLLTNEADCLRTFMQTRMREFYGAEFDDASLEAVGGVRADYLHAAMEEIHTQHGSTDAYLDTIGVDAVVRASLQARYLTSV